MKDERATVRNLEFGTNLLDEGLSDLKKECLAPTYVGSKAQYEQTCRMKDGRTTVGNLEPEFDTLRDKEMTVWNLEHKLSAYDKKLSNLTKDGLSPSCVGPNALIEMNTWLVEDGETTVWNPNSAFATHDEKLSDITVEHCALENDGSNVLIEQTCAMFASKETTVQIRVGQEFAKPENLLDTNKSLLNIFGLVARAGRGAAELPDPDLGLIIREETTVRNPVCKTQPTFDWMKSSKTDKFSVTVANAGRGVAELQVVPVSQGWRAKCSQKEFLKKTGEVDKFKKNNHCKKSKDFKNDDGSDKTDGFKETDNFKVDICKKNNDRRESKDFKNDDGSDKTDGFKKTDNFKVDICKKNNDRRKTKDFKNDDGSDKTDGFKKTDDFRRTEDSKKNDVDFKRNADPRNNGEPEISFELEMNCGPEKHCDLKLTSDQEPMSDLWLLLRYSGIDEIYWSGVWFGEVSWIGEIYLSCEVSWYDWDVEKDELSPGLSELNLSKNRQEKIKLDLETVKIGFSVEKFLMKLFTGALRCKEWDGILPEEDVTFEGCRFLLQCREWFLVQIQVLARVKGKKPRKTFGVSDGALGEEASVQSSSQPDPGTPGVRNGFVDQDDGPHQEEEKEDVVLLDEDDLVEDQPSLAQGSVKLSDSHPMLSFGNKWKSSTRKIPKNNRVLSYDELIEGPGRVETDYDDLDFEFEIPKEVEEFEI